MKSDREVERDVLDELEWEPGVTADNITVGVKDGVVTLAGVIASFSEKWAAEDAMKRVAGVKGFANELEIQLSAFHQRTDADIARAAVNVLEWNVNVPHDRVRVTVENGVVTLDGEVDRQFEKIAAEGAVRPLMGVTGISNRISITRSQATPAHIHATIKKALMRNGAIEAGGIMVETSGGTVILRGTVGSWAERQEAERAGWSAPGVFEVDNHLVIEDRMMSEPSPLSPGHENRAG
jgi:osmotically-inducible protein OsmY